jgi:tetratricopeptide (TPR) repeat protein
MAGIPVQLLHRIFNTRTFMQTASIPTVSAADLYNNRQKPTANGRKPMYRLIVLIAVFAFIIGCSTKTVITEPHPTDSAPQTIKQSKVTVSDNHLDVGKKLYFKGKYNQATKHLVRSIANNKENWEAFYFLGLTQQKQERYDRAIGSFNNSLKYAPINRSVRAKIHFALGISWEEEGYLYRAKDKYSQAARLDPRLDSAKVGIERVTAKTLKAEKEKKEKETKSRSKEAH